MWFVPWPWLAAPPLAQPFCPLDCAIPEPLAEGRGMRPAVVICLICCLGATSKRQGVGQLGIWNAQQCEAWMESLWSFRAHVVDWHCVTNIALQCFTDAAFVWRFFNKHRSPKVLAHYRDLRQHLSEEGPCLATGRLAVACTSGAAWRIFRSSWFRRRLQGLAGLPSWKDEERFASKSGHGVPRIPPKFQHALAFRPDFAGSSATRIGLHSWEAWIFWVGVFNFPMVSNNRLDHPYDHFLYKITRLNHLSSQCRVTNSTPNFVYKNKIECVKIVTDSFCKTPVCLATIL